MHSQRDTHPNRSNLTKSKEESLVARIRDLSLSVRAGTCVGIN
ncbi:hypothetical protein M3J07_004680 [Ascochyta lentis]